MNSFCQSHFCKLVLTIVSHLGRLLCVTEGDSSFPWYTLSDFLCEKDGDQSLHFGIRYLIFTRRSNRSLSVRKDSQENICLVKGVLWSYYLCSAILHGYHAQMSEMAGSLFGAVLDRVHWQVSIRLADNVNVKVVSVIITGGLTCRCCSKFSI